MREEITIEDRLKHGNVTLKELSLLSRRCRAAIYNDIKRGILTPIKLGKHNSAPVFVPGPIARQYISGELHRSAEAAA